MNIDIKDIYEFSALRIACHVKSMNYFAGLLGYHFPEHDNDKNCEPMRTGYAYVIYGIYHKNFRLTEEYEKFYYDAHKTHHEHATHHIQHYEKVADIPDIRIYEMVSDWASANFEQMKIICLKDAIGICDWFEKKCADNAWTPHQLDIIKKSIQIINENTDETVLRKIWAPVLEKSDL